MEASTAQSPCRADLRDPRIRTFARRSAGAGDADARKMPEQLGRSRGGAGERNRTLDLLITNELLYRLSYIGTAENYIRAL